MFVMILTAAAAARLKRERRARANEWKRFRRTYLFTQRRLADTMGISRRTVQQIENCYITPHPRTLRRFEELIKRYQDNSQVAAEVDWRAAAAEP